MRSSILPRLLAVPCSAVCEFSPFVFTQGCVVGCWCMLHHTDIVFLRHKVWVVWYCHLFSHYFPRLYSSMIARSGLRAVITLSVLTSKFKRLLPTKKSSLDPDRHGSGENWSGIWNSDGQPTWSPDFITWKQIKQMGPRCWLDLGRYIGSFLTMGLRSTWAIVALPSF